MRCLPVIAAALGCMLLGLQTVPATADPTPARTEAPRALPPTAPVPTARGKSPDAPDPHPPLGGIGPIGEPVGGARLLGRGLVLPANAPRPPKGVNAAAWIIFDPDSGAIIAARDPHGRYQPASILKTLTCLVLLPVLTGSRVVTVSRTAADAEGSRAGLVPGGHYTVDQLFSALLLVSGNDAAVALAEAAGGVQRTVALMNAAALRMGAYDTFVQTPSGLDGWQQLTSAYDMALFLRAALDQPRFVAYDRSATSKLPRQKVNGYGPVTLWNQNQLFLSTVRGALVAKTGFTDAAQHTFVGAMSRGGHRLGVVFLRAQRWPKDQWQQAVALMNWGFALPPSTAPVGQLDPPVASSTTASVHPKAGGVNAAGVVASARRDDDVGTTVLILGMMVIAGAVLWWRLRQPSPRRAGKLAE